MESRRYKSQVDRVAAAAERYRARRARADHPVGYMQDSRWWPGPREKQACCYGLADPTVEHPYTLQQHCRTVGHVAAMFMLHEHDLRAVVDQSTRWAGRAGNLCGRTFWMPVAHDMFSGWLDIDDGVTVYEVGRLYRVDDTKRGKGFRTYSTQAAAATERNSIRAALSHSARAVLPVLTGGTFSVQVCGCDLCIGPGFAVTGEPEPHDTVLFTEVMVLDPERSW